MVSRLLVLLVIGAAAFVVPAAAAGMGGMKNPASVPATPATGGITISIDTGSFGGGTLPGVTGTIPGSGTSVYTPASTGIYQPALTGTYGTGIGTGIGTGWTGGLPATSSTPVMTAVSPPAMTAQPARQPPAMSAAPAPGQSPMSYFAGYAAGLRDGRASPVNNPMCASSDPDYRNGYNAGYNFGFYDHGFAGRLK